MATFEEKLDNRPKTPREWQEYRFNKCMDFWQRVADRYWGVEQRAIIANEGEGDATADD